MKKLNSITLTFENCDSIDIPTEFIKPLYIDDIREEYRINPYQFKDGEYFLYRWSNNVYFKLLELSFNLKTEMGFILKERIKNQDITIISLNFEIPVDIRIEWDNDINKYKNNYQTTTINKDNIEVRITTYNKNG